MTPLLTRSVSPLPPGTAFARYMRGLKLGPEYARAQFPDQPHVSNALDVMQTKALVPGMTSGDTPDLATLGVYDPAMAQLLAGTSAIELCRPKMRPIPFNVSVPREETSGTAGGWFGESVAAPVVSYLFSPIRLKPASLGAIFVVSNELLRAPGADVVLRNAALGAQGRSETRCFLDPSIGPSGDSPASITYGLPTAPFDAPTMLQSISTSGAGLVWLGRLQDLAQAGALLPTSTLIASLLGIPILACPSSPAGQIVLVDLAAITIASSALDIALSEQATIEMSDAPTNSPAAGSPLAPVATTTVSLWETNSTGYRISRFLNWSVRPGAVAVGYVSFGSPV